MTFEPVILLDPSGQKIMLDATKGGHRLSQAIDIELSACATANRESDRLHAWARQDWKASSNDASCAGTTGGRSSSRLNTRLCLTFLNCQQRPTFGTEFRRCKVDEHRAKSVSNQGGEVP
jgi:hypothetical protein